MSSEWRIEGGRRIEGSRDIGEKRELKMDEGVSLKVVSSSMKNYPMRKQQQQHQQQSSKEQTTTTTMATSTSSPVQVMDDRKFLSTPV